MKITRNNYFDTIHKVGLENLPEVLKQSHSLLLEKTDNGKDWSSYDADSNLKRMADLVFKKTEEFIVSKHFAKREGNHSANSTNNTEGKTEKHFISEFLLLEDKEVELTKINILLKDLQKTISEKKITKESPFAKEIEFIQNGLLSLANKHQKGKVHINLKSDTKQLLNSALQKPSFAKKRVFKKKKSIKTSLNGTEVKKENIMCSTDFANLEFSTIGLKEKWLHFIGDPAPGFTAMVFGMPKMGKSYLCVDFAGYLARNHGKVLYVAKEEKLDATLQQKLKDKNVAQETLFVADEIPKDLSPYDFIFLDSVNKLDLSPKDLSKLKADNKGKSFIYVFQATKSGKFRGNNEFQHDVDVVIEVPEKGKAVQFGRFNQGGEMNIFEEEVAEGKEEELSGVKKNTLEIKTEFSIPLEELAMELIPAKEPPQGIVELLDHKSKIADGCVKEIITKFFKEEPFEIVVTKVKFNQMDSANLSHGVAFFDVTLKGSESELKKIAGPELLFIYDWENPPMEGLASNSEDNLSLRKNVSLLDGTKNKTMKKTIKKDDWTKPKHLDSADWLNLKIIKDYCDKGDYASAMTHARDCDTVIREEIPGDIWKKMGGQLTKTGEEKLKAHNSNSKPEHKRAGIVFNHGVRALKGVIEREWDRELTDAEYIEILDIAEEHNSNFEEVVKGIDNNLKEFLISMREALIEWDEKNKGSEKSREKFDPKFYANRKDDLNPRYIFALTATQLLTEALKGDFDIIYLIRRELANRGVDKNGVWVGFPKAEEIFKI
jgi:hypothetical protein